MGLKPYYETDSGVIYHGDCRKILKHLPEQSVNCVVTSPPYWGLRDYGTKNQIGLEPTPQKYVNVIKRVAREIWRVLRDDWTLWINLGDSYWGSFCGENHGPSTQIKTSGLKRHGTPIKNGSHKYLKRKDLCGIPWLVAFALQKDGWFLRSDIIWSKPNPMPESTKDRCTRSHEYIFMLSKKKLYYYDNESIKEPIVSSKGNNRSFRGGGVYTGGRAFDNNGQKHKLTIGNTRNTSQLRNKRSVWEIPTKPFPESHFATFPPALIQPCILAGCPKNGVVLDPFFGAGTTGVVCHELDRRFIGIEDSEEYCEMSAKRIHQVTRQLKLFG